MVALTTTDNPYSPFTQFVEWWLYDIEKGYYSCEYLDKIAKTSEALSQHENDEEIERAIDEIVRIDPLNIYIKVRDDTGNDTPSDNDLENGVTETS